MNPLINNLKEQLSSTWTLLNDTEIFLSRTTVFYKFEHELRNWRKRLTRYQNKPPVVKEIKNQIIDLRKNLRSQGYDLKLGSRDIVFRGFKSDDAPLTGYKRMVLFINQSELFYLTGEDSHLQLTKFLGIKLGIENLHGYPTLHNLWFRWNHNILELCGSDSESAEAMDRLKNYTERHKLQIIKKLKNLS